MRKTSTQKTVARIGTGLSIVAALLFAVACRAGQELRSLNAGESGNPYGRWVHGPPSDPAFFPICVWLQDPRNAARYKDAGINVFIGLWNGPTEEQLSALKAVGMLVIAEQNAVGLAHRDDRTIIAWMHGDEPDNAQSLGNGKGWGPPIAPSKIVADYEKQKKADPSRPVILNLGQGVAWDGWYGRGVRTNHPEDYAEYIKGSDIVSFDIYPAVHEKPEVAGNLWFVPKGVDRLRSWSGDAKIVWNCIECSRIGNTKVKPSPAQVRAEVWMSLIHGSMGIIYFVHQFEPKFVEASLLADAELLPAVTALNREIHAVAPALNSPSIKDCVVKSSSPEVPIDCMVKRQGGFTYVFAASMRDGAARGSFEIAGLAGNSRAEVLGEGRSVGVEGGRFADDFGPYAVHLYKISAGEHR